MSAALESMTRVASDNDDNGWKKWGVVRPSGPAGLATRATQLPGDCRFVANAFTADLTEQDVLVRP